MKKPALRLAPGEAERAQQAVERSASSSESYGPHNQPKGLPESLVGNTELSLVANLAVTLGTYFNLLRNFLNCF
jgi:hypothetical protein